MFVFVTSFLSPHVMPLLEQISLKLNEKVFVIECMEMTIERKLMGYQQHSQNDCFEIISLLQERDRCLDLIENADIVDYAWHLPDLLQRRLKLDKLTFLENERLLKKGLIKFLDIRLWKQIIFNLKARNKNVYFLSTGDYAAKDYRVLGFNKYKILRFGYFPKSIKYNNIFSRKSDNSPLQCIWVGRFINCKKTIDVLKAIKDIPESLIQLKVIGDGVLKNQIEKFIKKSNLQNVTLTGLLPMEVVREEMLKADVLISTSTKEEGWGAVINEAMNSGCAVISSDGSGAVPNLIIDKYNGFVYKSGNIKQLTAQLQLLVDDKPLCREIGANAYNTIVTLWNEDIAAQRLLQWIDKYNTGEELIFEGGPCSKVFK